MFEQSLNELGSGRSLGDSKVVGKLAGQFISTVAESGDVSAIIAMVNQYAEIFTGLDEGYTPIDGWGTAQGLGRVMVERLNVDGTQATIDIFRAGFGVLARGVLEMVKSTAIEDDASAEAAVDEFRRYMVAILLGTVDTLYPQGEQAA